jgi:hypothetical protein
MVTVASFDPPDPSTIQAQPAVAGNQIFAKVKLLRCTQPGD